MAQEATAGKQNWFARHKMLTGIGALILFGALVNAIGGTSQNQPSSSVSSGAPQAAVPAKEPPQAIKVSASDLMAEYDANEIAADAKYKGKLLEVSGTISDIGKDILDNPYIALKTQEAFSSVQCMLKDSEKDRASSLAKGTQIIVQGTDGGKLLNVFVRDCVILSK